MVHGFGTIAVWLDRILTGIRLRWSQTHPLGFHPSVPSSGNHLGQEKRGPTLRAELAHCSSVRQVSNIYVWSLSMPSQVPWTQSLLFTISTVIKFAFDLDAVYLIVDGWHHTTFLSKVCSASFCQNLTRGLKTMMEIEKAIVRELAWDDKHYLKKSADWKAQINPVGRTNGFLLICALRGMQIF